jgi:voltage-gated potassium channel
LSDWILKAAKHPLSPFKRRTLYSIVVVVAVLAVGTEAMHLLEGWSYVDSFYFASLIATAQGPSAVPKTDLAKIFAAVFSFISVGVVLSALVFIFGPVLGTLIKIGIEYAEKEEERIEHRLGKTATPSES